MSEDEHDQQALPGPGVIQPKAFAAPATKASKGSVLTIGEKKAITAARKREKQETEEQGKLLRFVLCGCLQAEQNSPNESLFQVLEMTKKVGEYDSKSSSSPAGLVKMKLAGYFYDRVLTFEGGDDDLAGVEKNRYIVQLLGGGQLTVPPSYFERDDLVDDEEVPGGEDTREFVIDGGRVLVSRETTLSLELPASQVWISYYSHTHPYSNWLLFDYCRQYQQGRSTLSI